MFGDVIIYRSQIVEFLKSEYLDTNHIDTFGIFLIKNSQLCPDLYETFIFAHHIYKVATTGYISHLHDETRNSFETDIRGWPVRQLKHAPTQKNIIDCGMYACKYMEAAIQSKAVV
ncbi:hypothetical protein IEQ34_022972 [Dendrobium chrysotoxum]|uniref:Ubiquitin-like protease family profile domain-containing protein n=1 Tax=Dendrobium chrysotoxum TaxID=161865 RepID=A0AAV7FZ72_DENCH|nr:hypothetical protein IEQ34_022972 [Dendrobium chrysotoxum]